jgi:calcineurin-like phosphoesterase
VKGQFSVSYGMTQKFREDKTILNNKRTARDIIILDFKLYNCSNKNSMVLAQK